MYILEIHRLASPFSAWFWLQFSKNRILRLLLFISAMFCCYHPGHAQDSLVAEKKLKVALVMSYEVGRNANIDPSDPESPGIHPFSLPALHFYEGSRLAIDSLSRRGQRYDLVCFEAPSDTSGMEKFLDQLTVDSFNVVIGYVPDNLLPMLVKRAKRDSIKLILTQALRSDPIIGHDNCALAYASTATQCSLVVDRFLKKYPNANFIIIKGRKPREKEVADALQAAVDTLASGTSMVRVVDLAVSGVSGASAGIVSDRQNIIFFVSSEEPVVNPGLASLARSCPRNTIVCGMPTWVNFESIDFMSHERIQICLFDNNYIDLSDPNRLKFRKRFVNAYLDDPLSSGYAGYDMFSYLMPLLKKYPDADLKDILIGDKKRVSPVYEFSQLPEGGFENHRMTITMLVEYRFIDINLVDAFRKERLKKKMQGK
jgi:hypothetical protein